MCGGRKMTRKEGIQANTWIVILIRLSKQPSEYDVTWCEKKIPQITVSFMHTAEISTATRGDLA